MLRLDFGLMISSENLEGNFIGKFSIFVSALFELSMRIISGENEFAV